MKRIGTAIILILVGALLATAYSKYTTQEIVETSELCDSRSRILTEYDHASEGGPISDTRYTVSVDGEILPFSEVARSRDEMIMKHSLVSLDCKRVAWILSKDDEMNTEGIGKYVKPRILRTVQLGGTAVQEFELPQAGPAYIEAYLENEILVRIGHDGVVEYDVPQDIDLEGTYYSINPSNGEIRKIGGPYMAISPDASAAIVREDDKIYLKQLNTDSSLLLADMEQDEYVTDFIFSPDSARIAYLKLKADKNTVFAKLYRPFNQEENIISAELVIQEIGGSDSTNVIRGGYTVDSFRPLRWLSNSILEYTKPETVSRAYQYDLNENKTSKGKLVDIEQI